ncbi:MAG: DNA-binding protein, partial [Malacoplasma sp.]|nr:DNA-binding protein [Malacoplasma sp.]
MKNKKLCEISLLIDFYGKLLTDKQLQNITDYYFNDLSLSEIAQNNNVSRVAIYDSIKKSENELDDFEKKLGFIKKF